MSVRFCFTDNKNREPIYEEGSMVYLVYQTEEGTHKHTQGFVRFKTNTRLKAAQKKLGMEDAHLEAARGTDAQNKAYCTKEDTRVDGPHGEYGIPQEKSGKGHRSDLDILAERLTEGATAKDILMELPKTYIVHRNNIRATIQDLKPEPPLERDMNTLLLWGPTGIGKTHYVLTHEPTAYCVKAGRGPFDNYDGEDTIFFDEFDWTQWTIQEMNGYLDKWPCLLNCRFFNKKAYWTHVVILANVDPITWWPECDNRIRDAFFRRIDLTVHAISREDMEEQLKL